jgi:hypothetical protein
LWLVRPPPDNPMARFIGCSPSPPSLLAQRGGWR